MPRLTKIYTRTGDGGETGLAGGQRVPKDSLRVGVCGTVDELSSALGLARAFLTNHPSPNAELDTVLARVQNELFDLGAELATLPKDFRPGMPGVTRDNIVALERLMDELNAKLGPLPEFILPGGSPAGAALHLARTICRRAEREAVRLAREETTTKPTSAPLPGGEREAVSRDGAETVGEFVLPYLNRLGDALFVLARWANQQAGVRESCWKKQERPGGGTPHRKRNV